MTFPDEDDDGFTELIDGVFPRVDLVGAPANGVSFLIAKSAADNQRGVVEAAVVRSLVAKAKKDKPKQGVFTQDGKLVGLVDPDDLQPILTGDEQAEQPQPAPMSQADMDDFLAPAPPDLAGVPANAVAKAAALGGTLTPAGAVLAVIHGRAAAIAKGEHEEQVRRSTVNQQDHPVPQHTVAARPSPGVRAEEQARRGSIRDTAAGNQPHLGHTPAEQAVINKAIAVGLAAERAVAAGTMTEAGAAITRAQANGLAAREIATMRARGQSGVVRKTAKFKTLADAWAERAAAKRG